MSRYALLRIFAKYGRVKNLDSLFHKATYVQDRIRHSRRHLRPTRNGPRSPYVKTEPYVKNESHMESDTTASYAATDTSEPLLSSSANLSVPPPRRRVSLGNTGEQYGPGGRSAGNRPVGILKCSSCKGHSKSRMEERTEWKEGIRRNCAMGKLIINLFFIDGSINTLLRCGLWYA